MTFRKADIETHSAHLYGEQYPAVNVKVHGYAKSEKEIAAFCRAELVNSGHEPAFRVWLDALDANDPRVDAAWNSAIEQGWDALSNNAHELFGRHATVNSAGRSGGWCIVSGLPSIESWDALMLSKWAKFSKWAKQEAAGVPYSILWYLYHNHFLPDWENTNTLAKGMCE